jgi:hypothetical protein
MLGVMFEAANLRRAFAPPLLAEAYVAFWLVATGFATWATLLGLGPVVVLAAPFLLFAYGSWRRWLWVLWVDLVTGGVQVFEVIGSAVEVARGGADKAAILAPSGLSPLLAAELNLALALAGTALFGWTLARLASARPKG